MIFTKNDTFELSNEVLYFDSKDKVMLTYLTDDQIIFSLDHLAKDAFMLAVNNYSYQEILNTSKLIFTSDQGDLELKINLLFEQLVVRKILLVKG